MSQKNCNVVVMGGGTGTFPVISALKHLPVNVSTIIAVSDSGGSTGRIRDEFGFQPVGDLRQSLAAMAESEGEQWIRKILLYRFDKGKGLRGHNLGNLILTALQDMTGDTTKALEIAEKVFRIEGTVIPVTQDDINIEIHYADGSQAVGEHNFDEDTAIPKKVEHIALTPHASLNPLAKKAILAADFILIGPGDYYASIMAVLMVDGIKEAFAQSQAKVMYLLNIMSRATQTLDMSAQDHVTGIEEALGQKLEYILINDQDIDPDTLDLYSKEKEYPVVDDLTADPRVVRKPLLSDELVHKQTFDTTHRSLLRHDSRKLMTTLAEILDCGVSDTSTLTPDAT